MRWSGRAGEAPFVCSCCPLVYMALLCLKASHERRRCAGAGVQVGGLVLALSIRPARFTVIGRLPPMSKHALHGNPSTSNNRALCLQGAHRGV